MKTIFKLVLLCNASKFILVHNHPSGDAAPSNDDINSSKRILQAGELLGISLMDSLIIGKNSYTSLVECGLL